MIFKYEGFINCSDGEILKERISVKEKEVSNGVTAVFVDALIKPKYGEEKKGTIHPDKGVCVDVCFNGEISEVMANYRCDKFISPKAVEFVCDEKVVLKEDGEYAYVKDGKLYIQA